MAATITLREAAEELGVHYMTAYRYVRLGQLPATKEGVEWRVRPSDVANLKRTPRQTARGRRADWTGRLYDRLVVGDESGAWKVIETAMTSAHEPTEVYLEVLAPALRRIGDEWHAGELDIATEHRASAIVSRLVGRLGALMRPRGRRRGAVVIGAPSGERHALPLAIVSDVLRAAGFEVTDLGADTPEDAFAEVAAAMPRLRAVGVGASTRSALPATRRLIRRLREELPEGTPIMVGGPAVSSASEVGADFHATDAVAAVEYLTDGR